MSDAERRQQRLQALLDGELSPGEIAMDPTLASIAERVYGVSFDVITPKKARDFSATTPEPTVPTEAINPTMLIDINVPAPAPVPTEPMPMPPPPMVTATNQEPPSPRRRGILGRLVLPNLLLFSVGIANLFGAFGSLKPACEISCGPDAATRINWLSIHELDQSSAWSLPALAADASGLVGGAGGIGIPDVVLIITTGLLLLVGLRRR